MRTPEKTIPEITINVERLDATTGGVYHDSQNHLLFQVGKSKQEDYETQSKLMVASLDPHLSERPVINKELKDDGQNSKPN